MGIGSGRVFVKVFLLKSDIEEFFFLPSVEGVFHGACFLPTSVLQEEGKKALERLWEEGSAPFSFDQVPPCLDPVLDSDKGRERSFEVC